MGWLGFSGLAIGAALLLWRLKFAPALWMFVAAAVTLGAAGYVWQGRPELAAATARPDAAPTTLDPDRSALRDAMLGRFGAESAYAVAADAMLRVGSPDAAVRALLGGIEGYRGSLYLWTELGSVMTIRDRTVSPAALLAFRRAASLNPAHPAPPFFLGLAQVRAGQFADGRRSWARALALTPPTVAYRRDIAVRLALLDKYLAQRP